MLTINRAFSKQAGHCLGWYVMSFERVIGEAMGTTLESVSLEWGRSC
jgi:hypothetical protein